MTNALSPLVMLLATGVSACSGALLFALCQRSDSDLVSKLGLVFVVFAPGVAMALNLFLHAKIRLAWLAAPMAFLACIATYGSTGYLAAWATEAFASKVLARSFWAIYWVGGFAFSAIYLYQARGAWRWTIAEFLKSRSRPPENNARDVT